MNFKQILIIAATSLASTTFAQPADARAPRRIERSEAIAMGNLTGVVTPQYPDDMRKQVTGKVVLRILIDKEGNVKKASLLTGSPLLVGATVDAVKQWKFRPYILDNERVEVETTATVEFTADPPYVVTPKPLRVPQKLRVSQGVMEGNLIHKVEAEYPQMAKTAHIQGDVVLDAIINKQGAIGGVRAISGHPILIQAAMDAVKQWTYKPMMLNGEPVEVETTILVRFHM